MISPLDHWKVTKRALEKYGYSGLGMLSFASLCESINAAQQSVQRIAFGAWAAGVIVGVTFGSIFVIVAIGIR